MILVDTSVWVEHLRKGSPRLQELLEADEVLCHPMVIGELACGRIRQREEILTLLRTLPQAEESEFSEVLHFLESEKLYGRGLGWIDVNLLASALISHCGFWTLDRRLRQAGRSLSVAPR
ncbi:MAG: PIN domain-containing protein [Candidatus Eisenbacteria sp.]|nr:PIN domain-containing protein [Candidatus Eisenbacteria bacterium]